MQEYQLVNFKMNPQTKKQFHSICKENHLGMTSILNSMIKNFIEKNQKQLSVRPDEHSILDFYSSDLEDF